MMMMFVKNSKTHKNRKTRSSIRPAISKSLWTSIKIAKDKDPIPNKMHFQNSQYQGSEVPEAFAALSQAKSMTTPTHAQLKKLYIMVGGCLIQMVKT